MFYNKTLNELIDLYNISIGHEKRILNTKILGFILSSLAYCILIPNIGVNSNMVLFVIISGVPLGFCILYHMLDLITHSSDDIEFVEYRHMKKLRYCNSRKYLCVLSDKYRYYEYHTKGNAVSEKDIASIIKYYFSLNGYGIGISTIPNEKNIKYKPNEA